MKLASPKQMNEIDSISINELGIPGIVLMENAALRVVEEISKVMGALHGKRIAVFAGKGNNGGDAMAVARHLFNKDAMVRVFLLAKKSSVEGDAGVNLNILSRIGLEVNEITDSEQLGEIKSGLASADLIVDGLLGTGLKGDVRGIMKETVDAVNASGRTVISIDMPSGVDGETGRVRGSCIKAHKTVTFGLPKTGQVIHPGCEYIGELVTVDIGLPGKAVDGVRIKSYVIDGELVSGLIPQRISNSNKGNYGKVLVVCGSVGMTGAGCLTAEAVLRAGAGLVYLAVPSSLAHIYNAALLESVTIPLEDGGTGYLGKGSRDMILGHLKRVRVAAVGPGLSVNDDITEIIGSIIENSGIPLILDADALNAVSRDIPVLKKLKAPAVLTPHPGEMARLAGISIDDVQNNRIDVAAGFAQKWGVTVVLKGSRTVVALPDGHICINTNGNSGMATGGTGDVLTGIIAGLAGQGVSPSDAAIAGVYIHGAAGDKAAGTKGEHGMIAGDMSREIAFVVKDLAQKAIMTGGRSL